MKEDIIKFAETERRSEMDTENRELELAFKFALSTDRNLFLTGKAGTGKTTFLHDLKNMGMKRMVVLAPTGVAAINAGGMTIHSFFQMPFGPILPGTAGLPVKAESNGKRNFQRKFSKEKINIIKSMDLLVIDEISMVRADLLDGIDQVLRKYRDKTRPFGGVQLLMIGDLQQLAPVVKEDEWSLLQNYYDTPFFFSSRVLKNSDYISIVLEKVYRQSDREFIDILNRVRNNRADYETVMKLNKRFVPGFNPPEDEEYIILTTHNAKAQKINNEKLRSLPGETVIVNGTVEGDFPEHTWPTSLELELKKGAQVMFVKNDPGGNRSYYNGKIGVIDDIEEDRIFIRCSGEDELITVTPVEWQNMKYVLDEESKQITETITGTFQQFPLKLAWAITIHKSQGLTFDKTIIDAAAAFAHGQVYVALSRCRTLEGIVLTSPLSNDCFINDSSIYNFTDHVNNNKPGTELFLKHRKAYQLRLIKELLDFSSLNYHLNHSHRLIDSHKDLLVGTPFKEISAAREFFSEEIKTISEKFLPRLGRMSKEYENMEESPEIQDRLKKASAYFLEKVEDGLLKMISEIVVSSDNRESKKVIEEALNQAYKECHVKAETFRSCLTGFDIFNYVSARNKAVVDDSSRPAKKESSHEESTQNPELYRRLIEWRNSTAKEKDLLPYMVVHVKALVQVSNRLPLTMKELRKIKGIGKSKLQNYGKDILSIVGEYMDSDIDLEMPSAKKKPSRPKGSTSKISFDLFNKGMSIEEIAKERNLVPSTIASHLSNMIESGDLDLYRMMDKEKASLIMEVYEKFNPASLTEAKEKLGDDFSYNEIKFVQKHLQYLQKEAGKENES